MSETCVLSTLVLSCESESSSSGNPHHLSWRSHTLQVPCFFHFHLHKLSYLSSFLSFPLHHFSLSLCSCLSPIFHFVLFTLIVFFYALSFLQSIIIFTISYVFPFAFGSEPSHLLNHLVKFVFSGDLP